MRYLITYDNYDIEEEFEDLDLLIKHLIGIFKENGYFISQSLNNNQIIKLYEQEFDYKTSDIMYALIEDISYFGLGEEDPVLLPLNIAYNLYTIDQLIQAYKKKMERNHARQDGTADKDKGYV